MCRAPQPTGRALRESVGARHVTEVRRLLERGVDPDAGHFDDGWIALHYTTWMDSTTLCDVEETVTALAEGGADLDIIDGYGLTPLMRAARYGREPMVTQLLALGADHTAVGVGWRYEGMTALEIAEGRGRREAAAVLREWAATHR